MGDQRHAQTARAVDVIHPFDPEVIGHPQVADPTRDRDSWSRSEPSDACPSSISRQPRLSTRWNAPGLGEPDQPRDGTIVDVKGKIGPCSGRIVQGQRGERGCVAIVAHRLARPSHLVGHAKVIR